MPEYEKECQSILSSNYKKYYEQIALDEKVNLNPYIYSEQFTVRERIIPDIQYDFFLGPYEFPLSKMRAHLRKKMNDLLIPTNASIYGGVFAAVTNALQKL